MMKELVLPTLLLLLGLALTAGGIYCWNKDRLKKLEQKIRLPNGQTISVNCGKNIPEWEYRPRTPKRFDADPIAPDK